MTTILQKEPYIDVVTENAFDIYLKVKDELERAYKIHGKQMNITFEEQYVIMAEEFGEIAKGLTEKDYENVKEEIVQTIAMLVKLHTLMFSKDYVK